MTALVIIVLVIVALLLLNKGKRKPAGKSVWHINYSPGMPDRPTPDGAGWSFYFPTDPGSHVHYVQWLNPPALGPQLSIRFAVTGGGFVPQEFPDRPATVSLLLQRKGDNWLADPRTRSYRWYSHQAIELAAGAHELTVPLDVAHWGDVYGGNDPELFAATLRELDNIGLVFGSDGGRGHGVYSTQPSRFTLLGVDRG